MHRKQEVFQFKTPRVRGLDIVLHLKPLVHFDDYGSREVGQKRANNYSKTQLSCSALSGKPDVGAGLKLL